jgi:hypothetical protein
MTSIITGLGNCYRCSADAYDHLETITPHRGPAEWRIACCFCGAIDRIPAPAREAPKPPAADGPADSFRFKYGRFQGLTFAETLEHPSGRQYLEWLATNNEKLKDKVSSFLATLA